MIEYSIPDMSCGHCKATVEKAIRSVDPTAQCAVDLPSRKATVESGIDAAIIGASIEDAGYPVTYKKI